MSQATESESKSSSRSDAELDHREATATASGDGVLDALERVASSLELSRTAEAVLDGVNAILDHHRAAIFIAVGEGEIFALGSGEPDGKGSLVTAPPTERVARVLATGRAALFTRTGASERDRDLSPTTRSAVVTPIPGWGGRTLGAVLLESDESDRYRESDVSTLMSYGRAAAPAVERAIGHYRKLGERRFEGELEVARQVMSGLVPSAPKLAGFDVAAVIEPCYEVGGDYYDFISLGNDRWGIALADVSGKGVPAALVVAAMRASLYSLAKRELALRAILQHTNEFIHVSTGERAKYVTLFYAVLDIPARRLIYINAGHLPPVVLRSTGDVDLLRSGGFPLGFFDRPRYFEQFVQLHSGDLLCLYTDGITEAMNASGEDYGRTRLVEVLRGHRDEPADDMVDAVLEDARRFSGSAAEDDATVLVLKAT